MILKSAVFAPNTSLDFFLFKTRSPHVADVWRIADRMQQTSVDVLWIYEWCVTNDFSSSRKEEIMRWPEQLRMRLTTLFRWNREVARLDEELSYHLDRQTDENIAAGMSPREARHAALRTFDHPALLRDRACATWNWASLESLFRDIRFAFRALRRTPASQRLQSPSWRSGSAQM
jgi:hypothetical protein